jgi:hypothetical protein
MLGFSIFGGDKGNSSHGIMLFQVRIVHIAVLILLDFVYLFDYIVSLRFLQHQGASREKDCH